MVAVPAWRKLTTPAPLPAVEVLPATVHSCKSTVDEVPAPLEPARMALPTLVEVLPLRVSFVKVAETLKLMDCNSRPPPSGALLPAKVLLVTIRLPPSIRQMPPPAKVEVFRLMVLASTVSEPEGKLKIP